MSKPSKNLANRASKISRNRENQNSLKAQPSLITSVGMLVLVQDLAYFKGDDVFKYENVVFFVSSRQF